MTRNYYLLLFEDSMDEIDPLYQFKKELKTSFVPPIGTSVDMFLESNEQSDRQCFEVRDYWHKVSFSEGSIVDDEFYILLVIPDIDDSRIGSDFTVGKNEDHFAFRELLIKNGWDPIHGK